MRILLTFDVEVWCNGWDNLDTAFPQAFERYVYGSSSAGRYALPKTIEILQRNHLHGVFFVEPLFAARFGLRYLETIVRLIQDAGQEVQLHLHTEWTDEINPPPLPNNGKKRQHLRHYTLDEQITLIALGARLLQDAGAPRPTAFRAGNSAANADTFLALAANNIQYDSSIDSTMADSVPDLRGKFDLYSARQIAGVICCPTAVFKDGRGRLRHAQIGACSSEELVQALQGAKRIGWQQFILISHNCEMLKRGSNRPDWIVAQRFESLCRYLAQHAEELPTSGFEGLRPHPINEALALTKVGLLPTMHRYFEQGARRFLCLVDNFCGHLRGGVALISHGRIFADLVVRAADRAWRRAALVERAREALEASEVKEATMRPNLATSSASPRSSAGGLTPAHKMGAPGSLSVLAQRSLAGDPQDSTRATGLVANKSA